MCADWGREDLQRALVGQLLFTRQQGVLIRAEVLDRSRQQAAAQISGLASLK